jgi:hypothetical protein
MVPTVAKGSLKNNPFRNLGYYYPHYYVDHACLGDERTNFARGL